MPPLLSGKQVLLHGDMHLLGLIESAVKEACAAPEETESPTAGLIQVPQSIRNIRNIPLLKELLRDAGFTNVRDFPLHDMDGADGYPWKEGALASIMIAGEDYNFEGDARYFDPGMPILVTYHSLAKDSISENERTTSESKTPADWFTLGLNAYNTQNYTEAVKWYRKAAEQGNADAQNNLGFCYSKGYGITQSRAEAIKWYRKAAEQGNAAAQNNLGDCYYYGRSVAQDYIEAVRWYRMAAEQGDAVAQNNLGFCYSKGYGITQGRAEAAKWYRKAAKQGNVAAQNNLGDCYFGGRGVVQNFAEAVKWYRKAAEQGSAVAQNNLGFCYSKGYGVLQSRTESINWYCKAAEQGNTDAQANLRKLGFKF